MTSVERIEDWTGREVCDSEGEKLGKLDEVFYRRDAEHGAFARVTSGLLGRHAHVVPLAGATVTRDHLRVAWTAEQVEAAPETSDDFDAGDAAGLASHYGIADEREASYESGSARQERRERETAEAARASELEEEARAREAEAEEARQVEARAGEAAAKAREEADAARRPV